MEDKITEQVADPVPATVQEKPGQKQEVVPGQPKKKKASWLRTILWMLSMLLLVNLAMAIVAYFMFFYKK